MANATVRSAPIVCSFALVMIADACEASSRALEDPTGDAIRALVAKRINEVFSEGQLDECELTLRDLNAIAAAMVRALLDGTGPEWGWLLYSAVFAIVAFVVGFAYFRRAKDSFEESL